MHSYYPMVSMFRNLDATQLSPPLQHLFQGYNHSVDQEGGGSSEALAAKDSFLSLHGFGWDSAPPKVPCNMGLFIWQLTLSEPARKIVNRVSTTVRQKSKSYVI